ncbi:MAG: hypothetical protein PHD11_02355 [Bacteroidales bacterium]|nr:hypothetical protein [Bacteroidales bacterium]MDD4669910.1 hypothetical protein [Bacteroidales bacterium]
MEEKRVKELGLKELNSSELQTRGGASLVDYIKAYEQLRTVVDFLGDYIPSLIRGFRDGYRRPVMIH